MLSHRYFQHILDLQCWPVNVPHSVGGLAPARLPAPGVTTRLSPAVHTPVVVVGWPSPVVTKSSLIWHISKQNSKLYFQKKCFTEYILMGLFGWTLSIPEEHLVTIYVQVCEAASALGKSTFWI